MKTILTSIAASSLLAALAHSHATVTDSHVGRDELWHGINNAGWVAGGAATVSQTGGVAQTAFLWHGGHMINLGTLGGPSSGGGRA